MTIIMINEAFCVCIGLLSFMTDVPLKAGCFRLRV